MEGGGRRRGIRIVVCSRAVAPAAMIDYVRLYRSIRDALCRVRGSNGWPRAGCGRMVGNSQSIDRSYDVPEFLDWPVTREARDTWALGGSWLANDSARSSDRPIIPSA